MTDEQVESIAVVASQAVREWLAQSPRQLLSFVADPETGEVQCSLGAGAHQRVNTTEAAKLLGISRSSFYRHYVNHPHLRKGRDGKYCVADIRKLHKRISE